MSIPIEKSLTDVREAVFARIEEVQDEYQAQGYLPSRLNLNKGVARGLLEVFCWGLYQLYLLLQTIMDQAFPHSSTGSWLDLHSEQVELERKASTKATGTVYLTRSGTTGNVKVPTGKILATRQDGNGDVFRFVTTQAAVLADGASEVAVAVEAETYGAGSNVTAGQISELVSSFDGIEAVENRSGWLTSEGADEETNTALEERYILRWQGNNSCNKYAYKSWAMAVTGVVAAKILDQHPRGQGTVDIVVKGSAGIPTQTLLDAVAESVACCGDSSSGTAGPPINDDWSVIAPTAVAVTIAGGLVLVPDAHADTVLAAAETRLRALFEDPTDVEGISPLQIGEDLPLDRLTAAVMAVDGVKQVTWTSPSEGVAVDEDGLAVLESLALTATEAEEA